MSVPESITHKCRKYRGPIRRLTRRGHRCVVYEHPYVDFGVSAGVGPGAVKKCAGHVSDSNEGRWPIEAAVDEGVPLPVLSAALFQRFSSRGGADFAYLALLAMRQQFGGHDEKTKGKR